MAVVADLCFGRASIEHSSVRRKCANIAHVDASTRKTSEARDLGRVLQLFRGHRRYASLQVAFSLGEGFCEAAILTLFARVALRSVDGGFGLVYVPGLGPRPASFALASLVALIVVRFVAGFGSIWSANRLQFRLLRGFRVNSIKTYMGASWSAQDQLDQGALQQLIVTLPNGISANLASLISHLSHFCIMAAMLIYALFTDAALTTLLVVVIGISTFGFRPLRKWIRIRSSRAILEQQRLSQASAELSNLKFELQAFGVGHQAIKPLLQTVETEASLSEMASRLRGAVVPVFTTLLYLAVTFGLVVLAQTNSENFEKTGPILLVVLRSLSYGVSIQQAASSVAAVIPSIDVVTRESARLGMSHRAWGDHELKKCVSLELENVSFRYHGADELSLKEVSAAFYVGGKIGIVGPSGGGKTTLIRIALGVLDPTSGRVVLNGKELRSFDQSALARKVAVVPQSAAMLRGSVAYNLALFREEITEEDMWESLRIADLDRDIRRLPDGLKTVIGTGHHQLSGGQQQRLAIARAFAGRPDLVVMDEPTSSVDALSEASISQAIDNLPVGVTVLIVSHRMRILEGCQQLVVMQDGRISAIGAPEDILNVSEYVRALDLT